MTHATISNASRRTNWEQVEQNGILDNSQNCWNWRLYNKYDINIHTKVLNVKNMLELSWLFHYFCSVDTLAIATSNFFLTKYFKTKHKQNNIYSTFKKIMEISNNLLIPLNLGHGFAHIVIFASSCAEIAQKKNKPRPACNSSFWSLYLNVILNTK